MYYYGLKIFCVLVVKCNFYVYKGDFKLVNIEGNKIKLKYFSEINYFMVGGLLVLYYYGGWFYF